MKRKAVCFSAEACSVSPMATATTTQKLASRSACALRHSHQCFKYEGKTSRQKCGSCGGQVRTEQGLWGLYVWTGDGRYPAANAVKTYSSLKAAEKAADRPEHQGLVVRWIPASDLEN